MPDKSMEGIRITVLLISCVLIAKPSSCRGNLLQNAIHSVSGWARHELSAMFQLARPSSAGEGPQCLNADGISVDWWVAIKPPSSNSLLYLDSQTPEDDPTKWRFSAVSGSSDSPPIRTLQQLEKAPLGQQVYGHVMYSDDAPQPNGSPLPDRPSAVYTQGRGVLGFGASRGFWISHSLPLFPAAPGIPSSAGFPSTAEPHSHSALCVSAATSQLHSLAEMLQLNRYNVYSRALTAGMLSWPAKAQAAASAMLLEEPNDSDEDEMAQSDLKMNEIESMAGERFVVLSKNGSRSGQDILDGILESFFGAPMLRSSQFWPRPCRAGTSGFPAFQPRELRDGGSALAWNASVERSHWQISFREGQAPIRCQRGLWDPDTESPEGEATIVQPPWNAGSAMSLLEEAVWSQTMTLPVTSSSRRQLLARRGEKPRRTLSEFLTYGTEGFVRPLHALAQQLAHRLLGSPEMAASLAMRRSVLSMPSMQNAVAGHHPQTRVTLEQEQPSWGLVDRLHACLQPLLDLLRGRWQVRREEALYQPPDVRYPSAAADILAARSAAVQEVLAFDRALATQPGVQEGLQMELRLTGASSAAPEKAQPSIEAVHGQEQDSARDEQKDCTGVVSAIAQLRCRAQGLQQQVLALEKDVDRLQEAAAGEASLAGRVVAKERLEGRSSAAQGERPCGQMSEGEAVRGEKYTACFRDRGRSVEAGGLPGGAVCFGRNVGLWHAFRALVQSYDYCS